MKSIAIQTNTFSIPTFIGELHMIPFELGSLEGVPEKFKATASAMLDGIPGLVGTAFFTIHGKMMKTGETLRKRRPHIDGNYNLDAMSFDPKPGWRGYQEQTGGLLLLSNYQSSQGWRGGYDDVPGAGGDCGHIDLGEPFMLEADKVYYGNHDFIHESLPVDKDVSRTLVRITLPEDHIYGGEVR